MREVSPKEISPFSYPIRVLVAVGLALLFAALIQASAAASFLPVTSYGTGGFPSGVAADDLNGDGFEDLAVSNQGNYVSVLLGTGTGTFGVASNYPVGATASSVAIADLNGDGFPDLAVTNANSNNVSILLGTGSGSFGAATNFAVGSYPLSVSVTDLNGDGFPDLAVANEGSNNVSVLLGTGTGAFGAATNIALGDASAVAIADLNGDSFADIAVAGCSTNNVSILLGNGTGSFGAATNFTVGSCPVAIASGSLNGDGFPDLAVTNLNSNNVSVLLGTGTGTFGPATNFTAGIGPYAVAVADLNGDGSQDLAVSNFSSNNVSVLLGSGTGTFGAASNSPVGTGPASMAVGDFDGDTRPDLAMTSLFTGSVSVLLNNYPLLNPDVQITKTAAPTDARPGDVVTYTLKAKNIGNSVANDVVITDSLPAGLSFVSADAPCAEALGTVTCAIGSLGVGVEKTYEVKVKVDPWGSADPSYDHLLDVQRVEAQIDLNAGEQKTVQVSCPSGFFASDGSVRIDHIDQGAGDWPTQEVLESRASSLGTWQGTVKNTATGRAQAKIFAVCIRETTSPNGHTHHLITTAPVTATSPVPAGLNSQTLQCGPGQVAIQPGFISSTPADLVYSQPDGNGWKFTLDNHAPANVTFSIRCMTRQVAFAYGHTHDLKLQRITHDFVIDPGKVNEAQLTCADGSKGIVAGWDLDHGLLSLGNDPRPVTRAFKLYNPTGAPLHARLSLLCLGDRTAGEHLAPQNYINTAMVSTSSPESSGLNNSSSATVTAEDTDNFTPVPNPPVVKPTPNNPIGQTRVSGIFLKKNGVGAKVTCSAACSGYAKLLSLKKLKVKGETVKKGTVLAAGYYRLNAAGTEKLTLKCKGNKAKQILKKIKKGQIRLSNGTRVTVRVGS